MRRVVVTGLGTINPLGNNVNDSWDSLINSKSGLKNITTFDVNNYPCQIAGSIDPEFIREDIVPLRLSDPVTRGKDELLPYLVQLETAPDPI